MYLRGLIVDAPHPNLAIRLSKKLVNPSILDLVMLEAISNLEPLLGFLWGLGFPTLQVGPIDALARVPWLVALLASRPPHFLVPPGIVVFVALMRWVFLLLGGLVPSPVLL